MFNDVICESTARFSDARAHCDYIRTNSPSIRDIAQGRPVDPVMITLKGMFFVNLYGAYEFTIKRTLQKTVEQINAANVRVLDVKKIILCLAFDPEYTSISDAGPRSDTHWNTRWCISNKINNNDIIQIPLKVQLTDDGNIRNNQLKNIFYCFGIDAPVFPERHIQGSIDTIVRCRHEIAHGERSPSDVGRDFTPDELSRIYADVDQFCTYFILKFRDYVQNKDYIN